jgi:hypothetical protein
VKIYTYEGNVEILDQSPQEKTNKSTIVTSTKFKAPALSPALLADEFSVFHNDFWQRDNYDHTCTRVNGCDPENKAAVEKYIAAALKLKSLKGRKYSVYDELVAIHLGVVALLLSENILLSDPSFTKDNMPLQGIATGKQAGKNGAHDGPAFLPWHRQYLKVYEAALRVVDPDVVIPYWDWTDHKGTQTLFGEGLLGQFVNNPDFQVDSDLHYFFNNPQFLHFGKTVTRNFDSRGPDDVSLAELATQNDISALLNVPVYGALRPSDFYGILEQGNRMHGNGHVWVGGSMLPMSSPNDPVFWMHHANVDRLWAIWQMKNSRAASASGPYDYSDHYYKPASGTTTNGHDPATFMWPWDGGASTPAQYLPNQFKPSTKMPASYEPLFRTNAFPEHYALPSFRQKVLVKDVLDPIKIGPQYQGVNYSTAMPLV